MSTRVRTWTITRSAAFGCTPAPCGEATNRDDALYAAYHGWRMGIAAGATYLIYAVYCPSGCVVAKFIFNEEHKG